MLMKHLPSSSQQHRDMRPHTVEFMTQSLTLLHVTLSCMLRRTAFVTWFDIQMPESKDLCILSDLVHCCMK